MTFSVDYSVYTVYRGAGVVECSFIDDDDKLCNCGPSEGACSMAVPAMSTRLRTSALRMPSTHPATRNANHR